MDTNTLNQFNYKEIIIDEIALEGLEGISPKFLWSRLEYRLSHEITLKMKKRFWQYIILMKCISLYKQLEDAKNYTIKSRFKIIDEASGHLRDPVSFPFYLFSWLIMWYELEKIALIRLIGQNSEK